jgi:ATP-binding cassette, subfamily B, vacuolar membrane transporter HMT1/ACLQ
VTGALAEIAIAAILVSSQSSLGVTKMFISALNALAFARIFVYGVMIAVIGLREYKLKSTQAGSVPEERQSLLENGNESSAGYGSVPAAAPGRRTQVSGTGWLDYFAGFKILFPYLWFVCQTSQTLSPC